MLHRSKRRVAMTARPLCIAIIDENPARAAVREPGLGEAGLVDIHLITERFQLLRQIADGAPDVVLIDLESPSRDVLDEMFAVSRALARPIAAISRPAAKPDQIFRATLLKRQSLPSFAPPCSSAFCKDR
jgi:AmiR/NasT family two-component response regulator